MGKFMGKDEIAYLGSDTVYEGRLTFKGTVRVEGKFTGDIASEGTLNVGKEALVTGLINVGELLVAGHVSGEINAARRIVVYPTGVLEGTISTPSLVAEEGGIIDGQLNMKKQGQNPKKNPAGKDG